jgi:hypothetical protein
MNRNQFQKKRPFHPKGMTTLDTLDTGECFKIHSESIKVHKVEYINVLGKPKRYHVEKALVRVRYGNDPHLDGKVFRKEGENCICTDLSTGDTVILGFKDRVIPTT